MNLRDKYNALLMAFSQQEEPIAWSGDVFVDNEKRLSGCYVNNNAVLATSSAHNLFWIKIPKGATSITISANNSIGSSVTNLGHTNNIEASTFSLRRHYTTETNVTLQVSDQYQYVAFSVRINVTRCTFEFSK